MALFTVDLLGQVPPFFEVISFLISHCLHTYADISTGCHLGVSLPLSRHRKFAMIKLSHITVSPTSFSQHNSRLVAYFFGPELQKQTTFMKKYCNRSTYCSVPLCIAAKGLHGEVYIRHRKPHDTVDDCKVYIETRANA